MRFWKRRKKAKEQPEAKQNIEDVLEHLNTRGAYTDSAEYKRQAEHEMLGHCEEIIEAIRELEEAKSEYRIVTDYLNDIQKIRNIPKETQEDLHEVAGNVAKLNKARDQYLNTAQKISDAQFVQMQQEEDEIPDAIRRLEANEAYEAAIRRDMNYLEGEKQDFFLCIVWRIYCPDGGDLSPAGSEKRGHKADVYAAGIRGSHRWIFPLFPSAAGYRSVKTLRGKH